jgi:hypothetical protein
MAKDIRRAARKQRLADEKFSVVPEGFGGEYSMTEP